MLEKARMFGGGRLRRPDASGMPGRATTRLQLHDFRRMLRSALKGNNIPCSAEDSLNPRIKILSKAVFLFNEEKLDRLDFLGRLKL